MTKYFFHTFNGGDDLDPEGIELQTIEDVRREAVNAVSDMLREHLSAHDFGCGWKMRVTDETGNLVCRLDFSAQ